MALDAAAQGLGGTPESTSIGEPLVRRGKLRPVFPTGEFLPVQAHFLVYPAPHAQRPEVMSFVEWVLERADRPDPRYRPAGLSKKAAFPENP